MDNFGDIGVTWRLARQLKQEGALPAQESEVQVRLWVDDLASFARICPGLDPALESQWVDGIHIQHWHETLPADTIPARVVIEAFACELPAPFVAKMASQPSPLLAQPRIPLGRELGRGLPWPRLPNVSRARASAA